MSPTELPPSPWVFNSQVWPDDDCVAMGADLEPATIVAAYSAGAFPMPHDDVDEMLWWSPRERGVLRIAEMKVSRSLRKSRARLHVTVDESFDEVIAACADPRRTGAWIDGQIMAAYRELHRLGWAHSV
ncbi:MAG: leucyl/phenylalanyl-tRNA--protein transferase [Nocardioidaceae bacterium]|nr:leucyl/phenylalanyl-tRNA--protein transferase [Nocardioidaceae bacterium]